MDENITIDRKGDTLTITIKLSGPGVMPTKSSSGKSMVIASTRGNIALPGKGGYKMGLNIYGPVE
jgi:hypothetical protein